MVKWFVGKWPRFGERLERLERLLGFYRHRFGMIPIVHLLYYYLTSKDQVVGVSTSVAQLSRASMDADSLIRIESLEGLPVGCGDCRLQIAAGK